MKSVSTRTARPVQLLSSLLCLLSLLFAPAAPTRHSAPALPAGRASSARPDTPKRTPPPTAAQAREAYGRMELSFEANRGQTDAGVDFLARGAGYTLFLKPTEAVLQLLDAKDAARDDAGAEVAIASSAKADDQRPATRGRRPSVLRMKLVGADAGAGVAGADELAGKVNYFVGDDPSRWRANVPTYGRVRYSKIYPGIDVVYYGNQRQLEYDFVVAPRADASAVKLQFDGAEKVELDPAGDLLLTLGGGVIRQPKPVVYQEAAGARRAVEGGYVIGSDGRVGFAVGEYDRNAPLVIDPIIVYSTYLGGNDDDMSNDIAVDSAGSAYVCGETLSTNFPTANALDSTFAPNPNFPGSRDAFVTKFNATGSAFVYSTYLGGGGDAARNGDDRCFSLRVDAGGNAYLAGETHSHDFPTANAFQATFGGGFADAFVTKLNATGSALVYSTFLGGSVFDSAGGIALDSSNNAYITGRTSSANYPTLNPFQATLSSDLNIDAFVTKLNAAGNALVYSTYLGGSDGTEGGFENGSSIDVDPAGSAYVTGQTRSTNFPTLNPIQATFGGGFPDGDAFVTKLNATGNALVYSTYLGGGNNDVGSDIDVDASGVAHISGFTSSSNFPTANAIQGTLGGTQDGFVTKLNAAGNAFAFSTYFGGSGGDAANDIAVDASGNIHIVGGTGSTDFPRAAPTQSLLGSADGDAFVTKFNPTATSLIFSTYLGGSAFERANALALDASGGMYVTGPTSSTNFPTAGPVQSANGGGSTDAFVTKLAEPAASTLQFGQPTYTVAEGLESNTSPASLTVTVTRVGDASTPATVDFRTVDLTDEVRCDTANGMAYNRCDYATTIGTLSFAANETSKTISVFITDDTHVEGNEMFQLVLENVSGATLGAQTATSVTIQDNDLTPGAANPIDTPEFFVRQHYIDFLARAPEATGFDAWVNVLKNCGPGSGDRGRNPSCDRLVVSSSFFRSAEFLDVKGYYAYRFYEVAFDRRPTYREFVRDLQRLTGSTAADTVARQTAFPAEFTQRPEFVAAYPAAMTLSAYVDALFNRAEIGDRHSITRRDGTVLTRAQLADGSRTRADILREIVESREVEAIFFNRAFVTAQYFGYLRRDPEQPGFQNWLNYLNANPTDFRTMVNGFVNSIEYRLRFGRVN